MSDYIILGDSIMKGVMYLEEEQKYKLCKENKFKFLNEYGSNVINKSKMGATIKYCKKTIENNIELFKNSNVILSFGGNDSNFDWKKVSENPDEEYNPTVTPEEYKETYNECIKILKENKAKVFITNLLPIDAEKYFNWISKSLNPKNLLKWLKEKDTLYRWQEHYSNLAQNIAIENGCSLLDIRNTFLEIHNYKDYLCIDGIHPNSKGYITLQNKLKELIKC